MRRRYASIADGRVSARCCPATVRGMSSPHPFAGLGEVYQRARRGYPLELGQHLESHGLLHPDARALDIGSGTGQLALMISGLAKIVVALEPEPDMIVVGERSTAEHANIEWQLGQDVDVPSLFGHSEVFDLVTIGNAFHHTQRTRLLDDLDAVVAGSGGVAVCSSSVPAWLQSADWSRALLNVLRDEFGMAADRSGVPDHDADVVVLRTPRSQRSRHCRFSERNEKRRRHRWRTGVERLGIDRS